MPRTLHVRLAGLLLLALGSPTEALPTPEDDALGRFELQREVPPGVSSAAFLEDGRLLVLDPGASLELLDLASDDGDGSRLATEATAARPTAGGFLLASGAGNVIESWSITEGGAPERTGSCRPIDPLGAVAAIRPVEDGVLVVEPDRHQVRVIDWTGRDRVRFGSKGSGPGEFQFPVDAAVDELGRFLVVDRDNHRVQRFGPDGAFERVIGDGRGAFPGLLAAPSAIDVEDGRIYVAETLNHRVSVFDADGRYLYQWGMHALVPRRGEGQIHYPNSIDVLPGGGRAVVAEPFERRFQVFQPFEGGITEARSRPLPSKESILSHFDRFITAEDDLLAMYEPESGAVTVFDVAGETGINITVFTNHGSGWDDVGRLGAIHLDAAPQELVLSDVVNDRLQVWRLERDREGVLKYDPFMARLVRAVDLDRTLRLLRDAAPDLDWRMPRIEGFARARTPGAPLLALDTANRRLLALDGNLDPIGIGLGFEGIPQALVSGPEGLQLLTAEGALLPLASDGTARGAALDLVEIHPHGVARPRPAGGAALIGETLYHTEPGRDRIAATRLGPAGATGPGPQWGETGDADGRFWAPSGLAVIAGDRLVVVDQGNHRAQIFTPEGEWLSTFSLSSGYTTPRRKASDDAATEDAP